MSPAEDLEKSLGTHRANGDREQLIGVVSVDRVLEEERGGVERAFILEHAVQYQHHNRICKRRRGETINKGAEVVWAIIAELCAKKRREIMRICAHDPVPIARDLQSLYKLFDNLTAGNKSPTESPLH